MTELDAVIHSEGRLRIVAALARLTAGEAMSFPALQQNLGMTAGNLSTHVRKLEEAGYVDVEKTFQGRSPVTFLSLTRHGRTAFDDYTEQLRALIGGA